LFLKEAERHGASVFNGLDMLRKQAEEAWKIWISKK
jgi:shikimate 5-dehydrogenase